MADNVRRRPEHGLDDTNKILLRELVRDARTPISALARAAGIAESTCSVRVRQLQERGVITGFTAQISPGHFGYTVAAMVAVRVVGQNRKLMDSLGEKLSLMDPVLAVHNVSGSNDFLVHVVAESAESLRDFVLDNLASLPHVTNVETSLIFATHSNGLTSR